MAKNTTDWNINSDIYDIVDTVHNVQKRYIEDEDETTLSLGIFGYISDIESKKIQTSTIMAGQLGNEMFPTRARLTKNILTHSAYTGITDFNAVPAMMTVTICIKTEDIANYIDEDGNFYIDSLAPIFVEDHEFHLDFDLQIKRVRTNNGYNYIAQYITEDKDGNKIINRLSTINHPYLKPPFILNIGNDEYIGVQCTLRQCTIEEITDTIISDSIIENKTYTFDFDNQMADFRVLVTDQGETTELIPYMYGSSPDPDCEYYCYYIYTGENTIRITFDSTSYIPGLNSEIYIKVYSTLGKDGEFDYLNIDGTSEGIYVDLKSEKYGYKKVISYLVAVTDCVDGSNRKSTEELQKLIPKTSMARGSLTTDTDVENYFNLINTESNKLQLSKKVDNQISRTWYAYFVLKDDNNNIIPTNTIKLRFAINSKHIIKCEDGRYIIPAGSYIRYDIVNHIGELIDEPAIPGTYSDKYFNSGFYYYRNPYCIAICRDPLHAAFYLTSCNYDSYFTYEYINQDSNIQFIANRFHFYRDLLTDKNSYNFSFNIAQSVNDGSLQLYTSDTIVRTAEDGSQVKETIITQNIRVILVVYRDGVPYRWTECDINSEKSDPNSAIYYFEKNISSDSEFDDDNRIKISNLSEVGNKENVYGYIDENCEAEIYVLVKTDRDPQVSDNRMNLDNIAPGYEDYTITNIYSCVDGIQFFNNFTAITSTKINNIPGSSVIYDLSGVPVVGHHYLDTEVEAKYLLEAMTEKKAYIEYCIKLVEDPMTIDFKFFNTYGPANTYFLEDKKTPIGSIDITLRFKLSLKENTEKGIIDDIKSDIKAYIENLENIGDLHASNLITQITDTYKDRIIFFEFSGFNTFGTDDQHIINVPSDDPSTIPELINIRNTLNEETGELIPCIDIEVI